MQTEVDFALVFYATEIFFCIFSQISHLMYHATKRYLSRVDYQLKNP